MKKALLLVAALGLSLSVHSKADACGWTQSCVHRFMKPTHNCGLATEVLASYYWTGRRTATGERFDANGNTAAHRSLPFGTRVHITNPRNHRELTVRVNDRGPYGAAHRLGVKFDLARGAAHRLGMNASQTVCVSYSTLASQ